MPCYEIFIYLLGIQNYDNTGNEHLQNNATRERDTEEEEGSLLLVRSRCIIERESNKSAVILCRYCSPVCCKLV